MLKYVFIAQRIATHSGTKPMGGAHSPQNVLFYQLGYPSTYSGKGGQRTALTKALIRCGSEAASVPDSQLSYHRHQLVLLSGSAS
jgi:hypothetical protein